MAKNCVKTVVPVDASSADELLLIDPPPKADGVANRAERLALEALQRFNEASDAAPRGLGPPRMPSITACRRYKYAALNIDQGQSQS